MKKIKIIFILINLITMNISINSQIKNKKMELNKLNSEETRVILNKGTERPFTGEYFNYFEKGTYICKQCNAELYRSTDKFDSSCGWPSFDDEVKGAVKRTTDADGSRTEITCVKCGGHLGHVFTGERLTSKNTRHCVNSISLKFIPQNTEKLDVAIFAAGCFWGVEHYFSKLNGVKSTEVGYTGGKTQNPTYKEICYSATGHYEAIKVTYDANKITYEKLCKYFFEIHDFTQTDGQGPDIGEQYKSVIFYSNENQKIIATNVINELKTKKYNVATMLIPTAKFWKAEDYHQLYYKKNGKIPYCHSYKKIF